MDTFEHELDRPDKGDDSDDEVQLTMEDGTEGSSPAVEDTTVGGVVTSLTLDVYMIYPMVPMVTLSVP